jgi:hypothetical protein
MFFVFLRKSCKNMMRIFLVGKPTILVGAPIFFLKKIFFAFLRKIDKNNIATLRIFFSPYKKFLVGTINFFI